MLPIPSARAMARRDIQNAFTAVLLATLLSACGGGGGGKTNSAPNQAPTAEAFQITATEDTTFTGTLRGADVDGNALTYSIVAQPSRGAVSITGAGPAFSYVPIGNYFGSDRFTYQVSDGRASATATVTTTVSPVNDPPRIVIVSSPPATAPGARVTFGFTATDVDGDTVSDLSVEQIGGNPISALVIGSAVVSFDVSSAQVAEVLQLRLKVSDSTGSETTLNYLLDVRPLSSSGRLHTLRGGPSQPGLHLVITGDGYTQDQQGTLLADAQVIAAMIVETPAVLPYASAWNVHVLDAVSAESGVDVPDEQITRNTLFDGRFSCGGIARLLCVNTFKVTTEVAAEFPAYTVIVVVSNTDRYGGSGGEVAVVTRNVSSALIALHETGHTFAGLADEYVDDAVPVPSFSEAGTPNVTRITDLAAVKWRHWFADPTNVPRNLGQAGVGLFEGALYRATGYYRPTSNSFMRELSQTMGPVNVEAWIKAIYRNVGPARNVQPQAATLTSPAGQTIALTAVPSFASNLQRVRWYEDGTEVAAATDQTTYQCCSVTSGVHTVTVRISEISGLIRAPDPAPAYFEKTWQVSFN